MIKKVIVGLAFLVSSSAFGQVRIEGCQSAVSSMQFLQLKRSVSSQLQPMQRYNAALKISQTTCLSTVQLLELLSYFAEDAERLDIAMNAYPRIVNQQDIYDVYNAFAYFSNAFRFHDFVKESAIRNSVAPVVVTPVPVQINFPVLNYPDVAVYAGIRYCPSPLSEADFMIYLKDIAKNPAEASRMEALQQLNSSMCLTTSQCMKMATLLMVENNRLELLKQAYSRVYDEGNFELTSQVFGYVPNQNAIIEYVRKTRATLGQPVPKPCELTGQIFGQMHTSFARESSSSSRLKIVKDQLPRYNCYTSSQIKDIVALFSSSMDKLELSKFAFGYVIDPENYFFEVSSLLSSSMDRQSLSNYISSQQQK
jgi:hypothetical protein